MYHAKKSLMIANDVTLDPSYREVVDDIIHLELFFLLETPNDVFNSIFMYFQHNFFFYPSVN